MPRDVKHTRDDDKHGKDKPSTLQKKPIVIWTPLLHDQFLVPIDTLGIESKNVLGLPQGCFQPSRHATWQPLSQSLASKMVKTSLAKMARPWEFAQSTATRVRGVKNPRQGESVWDAESDVVGTKAYGATLRCLKQRPRAHTMRAPP
ncbi:hypothetical protein Sjap_020162 [Stephania japonica]|uniref:Uncharacterized protein n=1 Tax=Stephania japonica TaxID=461633 RepID=A0AAP0F7K9_9MAGN